MDQELPVHRASIWQVTEGITRSCPQEIVTLISVPCAGGYTATAYRTWVHDLNGTGLENDQMDPVVIHETGSRPGLDLDAFHTEALSVMDVRRITDYDVADLFVSDP